MRKDKEIAIKLRSSGKTYTEISRELGILKGTLSGWFCGLEWSDTAKKLNSLNANTKARAHMIQMNILRKEKLTAGYELMKVTAENEFSLFATDPHFIAALMLYLGEGDKSLKTGMVRITNTDPAVLRIFTIFLEKFCAIKKERLRAWILLYPDLNENDCKKYWSQALLLPHENFYKSQTIQGKHKTKRLHYGVGTIIIGDKRLKVKILRWIELLSEQLTNSAGMV